MLSRFATCITLLFLVLSSIASGQQETKSSTDQASAKEIPKEKLKTTEHTVNIAGTEIKYTATAGQLVMKSDDGKAKANVFFVAYTRDGTSNQSQRPISFCFNGGPGSSSVWLHMGMLGPRTIKFPANATPLKPPYRSESNPYSLLDVTDLVFIDPVSTGYSRPATGEKKGQFHGFHEDLRSVGQFIHDYTTRFQRWSSPKYLIGESYGGLRAAGLAGQLRDRYNMELNGVVLISAVVDFSTLRFSTNNDLPYILFLPSYTATAWYHKALPADLQKLTLDEVLKQSQAFAIGAYASGLLQGDALAQAERESLIEQYSRLSGLSREYVDRSNLRVSMSRFGKELLRDRGLTIGRFDSRYTGIDRDDAGERYEYDASGAAFFGPFTAVMNDYLRSELEYEDERVYEILTGNVFPWSYDSFENRYVDASEMLRQAMIANPHLKLFAACGYYDLATPFFAMDYTINHLGLAPVRTGNITQTYYPAGHMMYVHEPSMKQLRADLLQWYAK
ncbi:MAG: peptidase S10 [Planctomycetaceae bacterium]|nr:peptidase S10 [Planctomycetaceae bacterium]